MKRRNFPIATVIIASVVITACSEMTGPKNDPGAVPAAAILGPRRDVVKPATMVATINGGGTAEMQPPLAAGTTHWGAGIKLYSDGTASGSFDCVHQHGDAPGFPGNIFGHVTSWFIDGNGYVSRNVVGKFVAAPGGHPQDVAFIVRIQQFGGAGVGHWTLEIDGFVTCYELLTSGQLVYHPE